MRPGNHTPPAPGPGTTPLPADVTRPGRQHEMAAVGTVRVDDRRGASALGTRPHDQPRPTRQEQGASEPDVGGFGIREPGAEAGQHAGVQPHPVGDRPREAEGPSGQGVQVDRVGVTAHGGVATPEVRRQPPDLAHRARRDLDVDRIHRWPGAADAPSEEAAAPLPGERAGAADLGDEVDEQPLRMDPHLPRPDREVEDVAGGQRVVGRDGVRDVHQPGDRHREVGIGEDRDLQRERGHRREGHREPVADDIPAQPLIRGEAPPLDPVCRYPPPAHRLGAACAPAGERRPSQEGPEARHGVEGDDGHRLRRRAGSARTPAGRCR